VTRRVVHYELEVGYDCLYQPLCENQRGRDAIADIDRGDFEGTTDETQVTCRSCLKALGYEVPAKAVPFTRMSIDLTEDSGRIAA